MNNLVHRIRRPTSSSQWLRQWLFFTLCVFALLLTTTRFANAQTVDVDRVVAELEPEIQRTLIAGNSPAAIAR